MTSPFTRPDAGICRHDLIFVSPTAWRRLLETRNDLAEEPLATEWIDRGWPLTARRFAPSETSGLPLGLPLPPLLGKRHFSLLMQPEYVISSAPPLPLSFTLDAAPLTWRRTLRQVADLAAEHEIEARIFGSLAWRTLTGLNYLTTGSDLDVLLPLSRAGDVPGLTAGLAAIEARSPMRLDGEIVSPDGLGVNWREIHSGAREVLAKTMRGVALIGTEDFLSGGGKS